MDVGGEKYSTTQSTLCSEPGFMLVSMFSGRHALKTDADGSYFIDTDGRHFRHVLN